MNFSANTASYYLSLFFIYKVTFRGSRRSGPPLETGYPNPCVGYILKGGGEFVSAEQRLPLHPGDAVFIPKGQKYVSYWKGDPDVEFYSLNFSFCSETLTRSLFDFQVAPMPELWPRFNALYDAAHGGGKAEEQCSFNPRQAPDAPQPARALSLFYDVYDCLSARFSRKFSAGIPTLQPALDFIDAHQADSLRIPELAKLCCMSESGFYAKFRAELGGTPAEYCNTARVQKAISMLLGTEATVEQISEQLGFSSPAYFRRVYRKITGECPTETRKRLYLL